MKKEFLFNVSVSNLTDQEENNTGTLNPLISMKNFLEKRATECIGVFMQAGTFDSIEDAMISLISIKSVLLSITTYEELFESIENEEFGQIGITCIPEFFEDYYEFLYDME